ISVYGPLVNLGQLLHANLDRSVAITALNHHENLEGKVDLPKGCGAELRENLDPPPSLLGSLSATMRSTWKCNSRSCGSENCSGSPPLPPPHPTSILGLLNRDSSHLSEGLA
ncbi:hypothetical protein MC885_009380, partial [Smutsia gigantea]